MTRSDRLLEVCLRLSTDPTFHVPHAARLQTGTHSATNDRFPFGPDEEAVTGLGR